MQNDNQTMVVPDVPTAKHIPTENSPSVPETNESTSIPTARRKFTKELDILLLKQVVISNAHTPHLVRL